VQKVKRGNGEGLVGGGPEALWEREQGKRGGREVVNEAVVETRTLG